MYGIADINNPQDIMARTVWGEARGEGFDGMCAVASVIINRVKKPTWWGHDVISVCTKPWQFSCWNQSDPNREKLINVTTDDPQFKIALDISAMAISGELNDITLGATSYYDKRMAQPPKWAIEKTPTTIVGNHIFFMV